MRKLFLFSLVILFSLPAAILAHEEEHVSDAMIEPLKAHHAFIEDELKFNFFFLDGAPIELEEPEEGEEIENQKTRRDIFEHNYELAWHYDDNYRFGSEVVIPFSNEGENDGERVYGLGDIEFQPLKYALVNKRETILTATVAITPPTGSGSRGFSEGKVGIAPHFLFDQAWRNWYLGSNQAIEMEIGNDHEVNYEYSGTIGYTFIRRKLCFIPQISTEFLGETRLNGMGQGQTEFVVLPGINLWNATRKWGVRLGISFPLTDERESNKTVYIQFGTHFNWKNWGKAH